MLFTPRRRRLSLWLVNAAGLVFVLGFCLWLMFAAAGCSSAPSGSNVHWYAPTTWPVFSGESTVKKAAKAEANAADARDKQRTVTDEATHAAHLEFFKLSLTLQGMAQSKALELARRFSANGLGLMEQFDPLTAAEAGVARQVVADFLSDSAARVSQAEHAQAAVETTNTDLSRRLDEQKKRADRSEVAARAANGVARVAAMENIAIANELRTYKWALGIAVVLVVVVSVLGFIARLQLGGVGAALHAAGTPAAVMAKINENTSALGQWFMRTGRLAAAKAEAVLKAKFSGSTPTSP